MRSQPTIVILMCLRDSIKKEKNQEKNNINQQFSK
jgi:hypothetical protein